jgi:DNA polymerase/3'-5' exonuclease PolX
MITLPLAKAQVYARKIVHELTPFVSRIAIAGSIRRQRPECHDIDIVCVPKDLQGLRRRTLQNALELCCGEQVFRVETSIGIQVDIYFAHDGKPDLFRPLPTNWGTLLLCRTGSAQHNIKLCQQAAKLGLKWDPHHGVFDHAGDCLGAATEEEVFAALETFYLAPERREVIA